MEAVANTSEKKEVRAIGLFASLITQLAMTAADTPDTRSWETLPARLGLARVRLAPGAHPVVLEARGLHRDGTVRIEAGRWRALSLFALR